MMFDFNSALFWYKFIFVAEIVMSESVFIFLLKEKKKFLLRAALAIGALCVVTFLMPIIEYNAIYVSVLFTVLFVASLMAMKCCFDERWGVILFCGIMAYTVQHFAYVSSNYISTLCGFGGNSVYESTVTSLNGASLLIDTGVFLAVYAALFIMMRLVFRRISEIRISAFALVFLSVIMLAIEVIMNAVVVYLKVEATELLTLYYIYDVVSCVMTVGLLMLSLRTKSLEHEVDIISLMLSQEKENYKVRKDKIDRINIMCHDLKHRIRELGKTGYADEQLKKLENAIKNYDSVYVTGNEVLDIVLAETGKYCEENEILFVCVADGSLLDFLPTEHIYALFDNALDNAVDAVSKIADKTKRYIKLQVVRKNAMVSIHVENCYDSDEKLVFVDGVPQTTKDKDEWHGYGMRSIKAIVEKYDGGLNVETTGDVFCLDIFLPHPQA